MTLTQGQILQTRYRVVALLGQGGFGAVYKGWDLHLNTSVAIKENLDTSLEAQRQFQQEALILANLHHNHLPRVTDHFFVPQMGQYLIMDFVEGEDLQAMLDRTSHALPEAQVLNWIDQVCDALAYLHSRTPPIIHRDIKPANIKITPQGKAVLVDFGISKIYDASLKTTIGARAVTPPYSPPEQYGADITDARSDVYALGVTLYTLLTGQQPPESVARVANNLPLTAPRQLAPSISPRVDAAIVRACDVSKTNRFQSVSELRKSLSAPSVKLTPTKKIPAPKHSLAAGAVGIVLIAAAIIGGVAIAGNASKPTATPTTTVIAVLPTDTVTATSTLAPTPSATATSEPTSTPIPSSTPTPSCPAVSGVFANVWSSVQASIGCAVGRAFNGLVVQENFVGGKMFWRELIDTGQALVLFNNNTWRIFQHSPYPGSPEFWCPAPDTPQQCPPTPTRGFGMMWCDIAAIRQGLGNATNCEQSYTGSMQQFERGFMLRTSSGAMYVFYDDGRWERK